MRMVLAHPNRLDSSTSALATDIYSSFSEKKTQTGSAGTVTRSEWITARRAFSSHDAWRRRSTSKRVASSDGISWLTRLVTGSGEVLTWS